MDAYEHVAGLVPVHDDRPTVVAVTGPVAVGKSAVAVTLGAALAPRTAAAIATDGFLMTNSELLSRGLLMEKGHPATYDVGALTRFVMDLRAGRRAVAPRYSHLTYDRVTNVVDVVVNVDVLLLEGLHLLHEAFASVGELVDLSVYVDASDCDVERWYRDRFQALVARARDEPRAFELYRSLDPDSCDDVAEEIWRSVNAPNVERFVRPTRRRADIVLEKGPDHSIRQVVEQR